MNSTLIDSPRETRPGEEINISDLEKYLQGKLEHFSSPITIKQFPGGHSNLTYLLSSESHEWILRRPPFGMKIKSAHDMGREFRILSKLQMVYSKVPKVFLFCEDESIIGSTFYIMERIKGIILRNSSAKNFPLEPGTMKKLSESLLDNLVDLHAIDFEKAGMGDFGKPAGFMERQVNGWNERYINAQTDQVKEVDEVGKWLKAHIPSNTVAALIHNDYKYDNVVLDPEDMTKIVAVLDWEMATIGDPLADLGTSLGYWMQMDDPAEMEMLRRQFGSLTALPGNLNRQQMVDRYSLKSGRQVTDIVFYYAFALFKIAVIAQQIYHRYKNGFSKDERFASMIQSVKALGIVASRALDKNRIYDLR